MAETAFWPIAVWASTGMLSSKESTSPMVEMAGAGRSRGGRWLKPNASAVRTRASAPISTPIRAKAVLHETRRMSKRSPPHADPPKLRIGRVVWGGRNWLSTG